MGTSKSATFVEGAAPQQSWVTVQYSELGGKKKNRVLLERYEEKGNT